ncbi:hypothetical protein [Algoriphagus hitonicola]|uniref:Outer membrane protein beta-barrel domain-containing protein n=1 Tax=Algoriphagus hitonicola TaxID=435880 RepID=A0A1I2NTT9_9BACT|nr:hypothetical protein [Algoriphagus hitonicola]SFG06993.1 hypothetical protein SAMN04487988_101295 [Algoriphagus hitonicola]
MKLKSILPVIFSFLISSSLAAQVKDHAVYTEGKLSTYEKRKLRQELSLQDGPYWGVQAGLRRHLSTNGNNIYLPISGEMDGIIQAIYGHRLGNVSLETGLGFSWHNSEILHQLGSLERNILTKANLNSLFLPLGVRYDIPVNSKKNIRVGAHASGNIIFHTTNRPSKNGPFPYYGSSQTEGIAIDFKINEPNFKSFYKMGLHAELQLFKSSFLTLQVSHVLSAPSSLREITYSWTDGTQSGSFSNTIRIEGWLVEVAYKLPLSILNLED